MAFAAPYSGWKVAGNEGMTGEQVILSFEPDALLTRYFGQGLQRLEPGIGDGGVSGSPQSFSRLQFG